MTEAEKLAKQWQRQFGNKQPPKNKARVPGVINRSEVITVPAEKVPKPRIPESSLSPQQRFSLRIKTGIVKADQDGDLFCEIDTVPPITVSLLSADYEFREGDVLDCLTETRSKTIIIGRRRLESED